LEQEEEEEEEEEEVREWRWRTRLWKLYCLGRCSRSYFLMRVCDSVCVGWIFREFEVEKFVEAGGETTTSL
jgi:hypothetical protein